MLKRITPQRKPFNIDNPDETHSGLNTRPLGTKPGLMEQTQVCTCPNVERDAVKRMKRSEKSYQTEDLLAFGNCISQVFTHACF